MEGQGQQPQQPQQAPGWYPNPQGAGTRYWDGARWTDSYQAPQKKSHTGRNILIVVLVVAGVMVLGIGGCVALIGGAANEADKAIDKEQNRNAITVQQFRTLKVGEVTRADVVRRYGRPNDSDEFQAKDIGGSDCIYYNKKRPKGEGDFGSFQLCFNKAGGKLESKDRF